MPIVTYGHRGSRCCSSPRPPPISWRTSASSWSRRSSRRSRPARCACSRSTASTATPGWTRRCRFPSRRRRQALYARYVEDEVVPYIRHACGDPRVRIATTGASFGAFHAANSLFRRPDLFDGLIAMSGFYDLEPDYLKGYSDDDCYFNNPAWYLRELAASRCTCCARGCRIVLVSGRGAYEAPQASQALRRSARVAADPAPARVLGPRREPRLAVVAADAAALPAAGLLTAGRGRSICRRSARTRYAVSRGRCRSEAVLPRARRCARPSRSTPRRPPLRRRRRGLPRVPGAPTPGVERQP